ncbi:MAG: PAS domain-containing protein [Ramlibacter sp.]|nr:PAS domain-containing protein [Ramlibacter sp.]
MKLLPFRDWSLRVKLAVLLLVASVIPLAIAAIIDIGESRQSMVEGVAGVLSARAEQVVNDLDASHKNYASQAAQVARLPDIVGYCLADAAGRAVLSQRVMQIFAVGRERDKYVLSWSVIDGDGTVDLSTNPRAIGRKLSSLSAFGEAARGRQTISDVYLSNTAAGPEAAVAYMAPIVNEGGQVKCVVSIAASANVFWEPIKKASVLAGPGSLAIVLDKAGVRVAHTTMPSLLYRPAAELPPEEIDAFVSRSRFGADTRKLLEAVWPAPELFARARLALPDTAMFSTRLRSNDQANYAVARRLTSVHWTVFYLEPQANVSAQLAAATWRKVSTAVAFIAIACMFGAVVAASILRPVRALDDATTRLAGGGDGGARVTGNARDEIGRLGANFNAMADRIESQSAALRQANADLEARVRERTGLLKSVLEYSPAAIALKDLQGRYLLVNERAAHTVRDTKESLLGKTAAEFFPKEAADHVQRGDAKVIAANGPVTEEIFAAEPDGIHTYLSVKFPVRDDDGNTFAVGSIHLDITDRKATEARLLAQLERMNLLDEITSAITGRQDTASIHQVVIRSLEDHLLLDFACIFMYDPSDNTLQIARAGAGSEELVKQLSSTDAPRIPVDSNGMSHCVAGELVYEPDVSRSVHPFPSLLARGGLRSLVLVPLVAGGNVQGVLAVARRQTDAFSSTDCEFLRQLCGHVALAGQQALLNEALREANSELVQSQQRSMQQERLSALGQMASGIAHDINNAISPAALYIETLLEREPDLSERARGYLQTVGRAIDDVAATVARMREFYRDRDAQAELLPVDLNTLAEQVIDLTRARWSDIPQKSGIKIELVRDLAVGLPLAMGIESEIREALINLVFNAVDAMPQGGQLRIHTAFAANAQRVEISVGDTGIGMDEATRLSCLEPFFTTKGERGTGLGLAMVYGIVQRHEAQIDIRSAPGQGTTVLLALRVQAANAPTPTQLQPQAMPPPMRLLVIDDDPLLLQSLGDTLRSDGHTVAVAMGGQTGVDTFVAALRNASPFDAVITDLGMPQFDGRKVVQAIKEASPTTPIILLTGWGRRLLEDGDAPAGVAVVLSKPPKLRELRAALVQVGIPQAKA